MATHDEHALAPRGGGELTRAEDAVGPYQLLQQAIDKGVAVENLQVLQEMAYRHEDRLAAREFNQALAALQIECGEIVKNKVADVVSLKKGTRFSYGYASLDEIARHLRPLLVKHGLSYSWDSSVQGQQLYVTCTVRHVNGHHEKSTCIVPVDAGGLMSSAQSMGSATSYGRRLSLTAALGIVTGDPDDDGASAGIKGTEPITAEQLGDLTNRLNGCGADIAKFRQFMGVDALEDIPQREYPRALAALDRKEREQRGAP